MKAALSKNGLPIRLPHERWIHLIEGHSEMAGYHSEILETVKDPDGVYEGSLGELLAVKEIQTDKYIVVVYKEVSEKDGFVITAFLSSRKNQIERRTKVWQRQK